MVRGTYYVRVVAHQSNIHEETILTWLLNPRGSDDQGLQRACIIHCCTAVSLEMHWFVSRTTAVCTRSA